MDEYSHKDVTQIGRFNCFTFNSSNVRLILKADVQVKAMIVVIADVFPSIPLLTFVLLQSVLVSSTFQSNP